MKKIIRALFETLGYSINRANAVPPAAAPVKCPPLRPVQVALFPHWPVELALDDGMQREAFRRGLAFEAPWPDLLRRFCGTPDTLFFDVGANFGFYSHYLLAHCPELRVHSFEPNPAHARSQEATANGLAQGRYFPHQLGLGDTAGELTLTVSALDTGWSTFGINPSFQGLEPTLTKHRVPVMAFDAWRAAQKLSLPRAPTWVAKLDVEGFEPRVVRGMSEALRARAFKALVIEVLDHTLNFCGTSSAELFAQMNEFGYAPFDADLQPTERQPQEARNVLFLPRA